MMLALSLFLILNMELRNIESCATNTNEHPSLSKTLFLINYYYFYFYLTILYITSNLIIESTVFGGPLNFFYYYLEKLITNSKKNLNQMFAIQKW